MADFEKAYYLTNSFEGSYANDKNDRGGETYRGIARNFHPGWNGWNIIDEEKSRSDSEVINISETLDEDSEVQRMIKVFYFENFWNAIKGNLITDQQIANEVYDNAVNMGTRQSVKYLQRTINILNRNQKYYKDIPVDGVAGKITINTLNKCIEKNTAKRVVNILNGFQIMHYLECMEKNPANEKYVGWFDRVQIN